MHKVQHNYIQVYVLIQRSVLKSTDMQADLDLYNANCTCNTFLFFAGLELLIGLSLTFAYETRKNDRIFTAS